MASLLLTGDVNLMNVADPRTPFARVRDAMRAATLAFSNLECNLHVPERHSVEHEGFFVDPAIGGAALADAGIAAVGLANNVTYGAEPIAATCAALDRLGIARTGAGPNRAAARAPAIVERGGVRFGFLQRSSVYWPTNHEASDTTPGIAVIRGNTAYQVPMHKYRPDVPPLNRPGIPPVIVTWAEPRYLDAFRQDIAALRPQVDVLVASCHWGLWGEVLGYMREIAHAAIDEGADLVIGHGPHEILPIERYRDRSIFYGLGSFSFHTGHGGRKHGDWLGMMVHAQLDGRSLGRTGFRFVRHNDRNQTVACDPAAEAHALSQLQRTSAESGATLTTDGDAVLVG